MASNLQRVAQGATGPAGAQEPRGDVQVEVAGETDELIPTRYFAHQADDRVHAERAGGGGSAQGVPRPPRRRCGGALATSSGPCAAGPSSRPTTPPP